MAETKNLDKKVEELEGYAKKYASKDTVISIGGYEFTPAKLMVLFTLCSSILGGLYGAFEVYKDYQNMKKKIAEYVTPDLTAINEKMSVVDKKLDGIQTNVGQATEYTNTIKNDLKLDIRRLENVVENVERSAKQSQRDVDQELKTVRTQMNNLEKETSQELRKMNKETDEKIKKALDNPLANK